jgi:hypothetical protein
MEKDISITRDVDKKDVFGDKALEMFTNIVVS